MKIGGKLMKALQTSGDKKLVGLWRQQMEAKKQKQEQQTKQELAKIGL